MTQDEKDRLTLAKQDARRQTLAAIKSGRLERKTCRVCSGKAEAHHPDYNKPFEVVWLCRNHHLDLHWVLDRPYIPLTGGDLTELQMNVLDYLRNDSNMINLNKLAKDCGAFNFESATLAIAHLVAKGYLKPVEFRPIEEYEEKALNLLVDNFNKTVENSGKSRG